MEWRATAAGSVSLYWIGHCDDAIAFLSELICIRRVGGGEGKVRNFESVPFFVVVFVNNNSKKEFFFFFNAFRRFHRFPSISPLI